MILLIASEGAKKALPVNTKWHPVLFRTRSGKVNSFFALVEQEEAPAGCQLDSKYEWRVDGTPVPAYFAESEFLKAWHSEPRGTGEALRRPHVIYLQKRELNIYEKLAAAAKSPDIIPPATRRAPERKEDNLPQNCKEEISEIIKQFDARLRQRKADFAKETVRDQGEVRRIIGQIARSYGQPVQNIQLPS